MRPRLSLRSRMLLLYALVICSLLVAYSLGFYLLLRSQLQEQLEGRLRASANPILNDLRSNPSGGHLDTLDVVGELFGLYNPSGHLLVHSRPWPSEGLPLPLHIPAGVEVFMRRNLPGRGPYLLMLRRVEIEHHPRLLLAAVPAGSADAALSHFRSDLYLLLPLTLLFAGGIALGFVDRTLRPIIRLTRQAASSAAGIVGGASRPQWTPLPTPPLHDELGRLTSAFNQLGSVVMTTLDQLRLFVSDASHELRTPLTVLRGEIGVLLAHPKSPEEYHRGLLVMKAELDHVARIVDELFTLAVADAGQLRLSGEPVYLNEILEECCGCMQIPAANRRVRLHLGTLSEVFCRADEARLRQLFLIFFDNAVKYSPEGGLIVVNLSVSEHEIRISFQDQGKGIDAADMPRIFDRFYRVNDSREETPGCGLGLAIARAIAHAYGGHIECASEVGLGSEFTLVLPSSLLLPRTTSLA